MLFFVTEFSRNGQSLYFDYFDWVLIFLVFIIPTVCKTKGDVLNNKAFVAACGSKIEIDSFLLVKENSFFGHLFSH